MGVMIMSMVVCVSMGIGKSMVMTMEMGML